MDNILYTKLKGVTFHGRQKYIRSLFQGQDLMAIRERYNPYDSNAIGIYLNDEKTCIGHLSKELARLIAPMLDTGVKINVKVENVTSNFYESRFGVNLSIEFVNFDSVDDALEYGDELQAIKTDAMIESLSDEEFEAYLKGSRF